MSIDKIALRKQFLAKSKEAAVEQIKSNNTNSMEKKLTDIFGNKIKYLNVSKVFEPTFYQCTLKESFYNKGGLPTNTYDIKQYCKLLSIDESSLEQMVTETPEFLLWLHEKRAHTPVS